MCDHTARADQDLATDGDATQQGSIGSKEFCLPPARNETIISPQGNHEIRLLMIPK